MAYAKVGIGLAYFRRKQQSLASQFKLKNNKTFIVPTGFGFAFGATALVLLIMAIGYGNNLLYLFVFFLISMALSGMWITNKNVELFKAVDLFIAEDLFANQENKIILSIKNNDLKTDLSSIDVVVDNKKTKNIKQTIEIIKKNNTNHHSTQNIFLTWYPVRRGRQESPRILIESEFPFRMLRAWKYFDQKVEWIVYPEKKGLPVIPAVGGEEGSREQYRHVEDQGLFRDYRQYQHTDSPRRIDWKKSLKYQIHVVKNFESSSEKKVVIDWSMTQALETFEERISQMALWVDLCQKRGDLYSLKINNQQTEYSCQPRHFKNCMTTLALLMPEDVV